MAQSRLPYLDNAPLDDTNDTIFLGDSDDDDDFFFNDATSGKRVHPTSASPTVPAGEYRVLPDIQERIYVSKPPWQQATADKALENPGIDTGFSILLVLTNGLGIESTANCLLADSLAREGYFVVMPDLFSSDPNTPNPSITSPRGPTSLLSRVRSLAVSSAAGFATDMWIARHTEERTWPMLINMIQEIVDIYQPRAMGVVGYSFGAKYALKLMQLEIEEVKLSMKVQTKLPESEVPLSATPLEPSQPASIECTADAPNTERPENPPTEPDTTADSTHTDPPPTVPKSTSLPPASPISQFLPAVVDLKHPSWANLLLTAVVCHPSLAERKDFEHLRKPVLIIAVEDDPLFPPELIKYGVEQMTKDVVFHDVKLFDRKLPHGFSVKGDYPSTNRLITENQAAAQLTIISWVKSFVTG
ncbi:uncharacterized protein V1518DRAFT_408170 [Limtongia smithiae]|uniref:uncharacterized protein n=1 Tax=Limtongia smithiae TaxID=1125753 RepID=UPI0034CF8915